MGRERTLVASRRRAVIWENGLVTALGSPLCPQQITEPLSVQATGRNDPVVRNDPAATTAVGGATDLTTPRQPRQKLVTSPAVPLSQLRCVKVGQADLNPFGGVRRLADAQAVPITDIPNHSGERLSMPCGQAALAGVGLRCFGSHQRKKACYEDRTDHGPRLTRGGFGLVSVASVNPFRQASVCGETGVC